jgi:glutathione S-transferase
LTRLFSCGTVDKSTREAAMDLYFTPMTCSLAPRIALYEAGAEARFHEVALGDKTLKDGGGDYRAVNPKGQVPALRVDGLVLTEVPAVLQYIADLNPEAGLAPPPGSPARYELQMWLNFVGGEVHKGIFYPIFNGPPETHAFCRETLLPRAFAHLSAHLEGREYLMDGFTVADAYLFTALNWAFAAGIDMRQWPVLVAYRQRMMERPAVARAFAEEMALRAAA